MVLLLGSDNSGIAAGERLFCIRRDGFVFVNGAPPGEETAVNDGERCLRRTKRRNREGLVIRIRNYSCILPLILSFFVVSWRNFCLLNVF